MTLSIGSRRGASLLALGLVLATTPVRAGNFVFTSVDDDHIAWEDAANWAGPGPLPTLADDATISAGLLRGAEITDARGVNSLVLDSGLNVYSTGTLTVTTGITANTGYFINDGIVIGDLTNNTYVASTGRFTGTLTNNATGAFINDGTGGHTGTFSGDVNNAGYLVNSSGIWTGDVLGNTGYIGNEKGAIWTGDVVNSADLASTDSTWNGDLINSGTAQMTGVLNGNVTNSGTLWLDKSLTGVGRLVNTGRVGLEDGAADDTLSVKSWSGAGTLTVDFDPSTMTSDKVVVSGDYSADTNVELRLLSDPTTRTLGTAQIVVIGGKDRGTLTLADLGGAGAGGPGSTPSGGAIVYELVNAGNVFAIVARPGDAVTHVADALMLTSVTLGTATGASVAGEPCSPAASFRGLRGGATTATTDVDFSGAQLGLDLACLALPQSSATLGIGVTLGLASGTVTADAGGTFDQRAAGVYARLVDGAFNAVVEGQLAATNYRLADPLAGLGDTALGGTSSRLSGTASYAFVSGPVTFAPELGLALSSSEIGARNFDNAGAVRFRSGTSLAAHIGTTLSADLALAGATLTPFASVSLHGDLLAPSATFTDSAGTSVDLDAAGQGSYVALALGARLVDAETLTAGLRTDLKLGTGMRDASVSGELKVRY